MSHMMRASVPGCLALWFLRSSLLVCRWRGVGRSNPSSGPESRANQRRACKSFATSVEVGSLSASRLGPLPGMASAGRLLAANLVLAGRLLAAYSADPVLSAVRGLTFFNPGVEGSFVGSLFGFASLLLVTGALSATSA